MTPPHDSPEQVNTALLIKGPKAKTVRDVTTAKFAKLPITHILLKCDRV